MVDVQLTLDNALARVEAEAGIRQAIEHAERECADWPDLALRFLKLFALTHPVFISEDVSDESRRYGLIQPPTDRAWGWVYRRAQRDGLIAMDGTGRSRRRHSSLCPRWRSLIYGGVA